MTTPTNRDELHDMLVEILGSSNVYFNPPESLQLKYPAIVYHRNSIKNTHADDIPYFQTVSYQVTVIDKDPESETVTKLSMLPLVNHVNNFTSSGMNHDVFIINL